jgi:phosphoenolpyruvate-protein phosphotransferase (PTS system enzyme I)
MSQKILTGIPVSAGISIGKAMFLNRGRDRLTQRQTIAEPLLKAEIDRLDEAFSEAERELREIRGRVPLELREHASIIDSHLMIIKDPKLRSSSAGFVNTLHINAEWALDKAVGELEKAFSAIEDEYIRDRIQDVRLAVERVKVHLVGNEDELKPITSRVNLVAHDLSPADTIVLQVDKIMAFVTAMGGKTSHVGILARSLQIPAVVGAVGLEESIRDGQLIIIDGLHGRVILDPDEEELSRYADLKYQFENYQANTIRCCNLPGETIDGYRIHVLANIELFEEVAAVIDNGGEGVGLYRTEFTFLSRTAPPTEEELFEEYRDLASILSPAKLIIRTFDLGGDKFSLESEMIEEANPAMGLRAVRYCLKHPEFFKLQLRAILRASSTAGNISLMFPMISGLHELREVKKILEEAKREVAASGGEYDKDMPVGIMIEVPSAVLIADLLAREVDFFSIGTNDLIQYSLGIDRTNRSVSYLYQPLHPAIVRSIKRVVDAGHQAGIEVSICGEVASDPFCIPILMGMEVDSISLNPQSIPGIKHIIRQTTMEECKLLLSQVLASSSVATINSLVKDMIFKRFPEELMFYASMVDTEDV